MGTKGKFVGNFSHKTELPSPKMNGAQNISYFYETTFSSSKRMLSKVLISVKARLVWSFCRQSYFLPCTKAFFTYLCSVFCNNYFMDVITCTFIMGQVWKVVLDNFHIEKNGVKMEAKTIFFSCTWNPILHRYRCEYLLV